MLHQFEHDEIGKVPFRDLLNAAMPVIRSKPFADLELIPKLAMNGNQFAPDNNGAGKMKESKIVGSFFLEANQ